MKKLPRPVKRLTSPESADKLLSSYYDDIGASIRTGISVYQTIPAEVRATFRARTAATVLNDLVVADAIKRFDGREPDIKVNLDCESALFIFGDKAIVRFKKTGKRLRPKNIRTGRQDRMECQLELEGVPLCTLLSVVYVVDEAFTFVRHVHLVCWNGHVRQWVIPIAPVIEPFLFSMKEGKWESAQRAVVRPKSRRKKTGG